MTRINRTVRAALACVQLCVALSPSPAQAARPMITDDARIVDPRACQLETWVKRNDASTEQWAIPACNPTGNLELAFGGARTLDSGTNRTSDVLMQAKTILKPLETNGWGLGLAVGNLRHPGEQPRGDFARNLYGYVPLSVSYADDLAVVHLNLGLLRQENESRHLVTAGVGAEIRLHPRLFLIPEVFRQEQGRPHFQAGVRYWIVPQRIQIDTTYGDRVGGAGARQWVSMGLRLITPGF
ncbi:MAG: hypothetical protein JWO70_5083 [Betaproteobacteria bacterium]|jgi:hypothetical protein|nr:hypothetical protein [Betaproteobacteria bacterium]